MTEKTRKILITAAGGILCIILIVGIALRFSGGEEPSDITRPDTVREEQPVAVDIRNSERPDTPEPTPSIEMPEASADPGAGAVSTGTEQKIQADPIKPEEPEAPAPPSATVLPADHTAEDVPEEERRTEDEAPPAYDQTPTYTPSVSTEPAPGSTNSTGQVYVPGFGYVADSGANQVTEATDMYENGNKIGIMGD